MKAHNKVWRTERRRKPDRKIVECKDNARRRSIPWTLSDEEALHFFTQPCVYCKRVGADFGGFNGIDRKDSALSYEVENCLPCCGMCNRAKGALKYEDMLAYIDSIVKNCGGKSNAEVY